LELTEGDLKDLLKSWGYPAFRATQVLGWVRGKGVIDFDDMGNVPKALREALSAHFAVGSIECAVEQVSKDGTKKRAYRLKDGQLVEAVLMPYNDGRRTACISSQAGCGMGCAFCATGQVTAKGKTARGADTRAPAAAAVSPRPLRAASSSL